MSYIKPGDVVSPKKQWRLVEVITDGGAGQPAYALGTWDNARRIGFRWNGTDDNPLGNPQSRGLPTWTILDENLHAAVLSIAPIDKQAMISTFLNLPTPVDLVVDYHPSGRRTLKESEHGRARYRDLPAPLFANSDVGDFYRAVAKTLAERQAIKQHVTYKDTTVA